MNIQTLTPLNLRETSPSCKISTIEASRICPSPLYTACIAHNWSNKPQLANYDLSTTYQSYHNCQPRFCPQLINQNTTGQPRFANNLSIKPQLANHDFVHNLSTKPQQANHDLSTTYQSNHNWPTTVCPQLINQTKTGQPRFVHNLSIKPQQANHDLSTTYQSNHNWPSTIYPQLINQAPTGQPRFRPQLINQTTTGQRRFCPQLINQTTIGKPRTEELSGNSFRPLPTQKCVDPDLDLKRKIYLGMNNALLYKQWKLRHTRTFNLDL